jgi:hypothetical protein
MSTQTVTLQLPNPLYERMRCAAQALQRPVEKLLLDAVTTGMSLLDDLTPELVDEMSALALLNDAALWRAARHVLTSEQQAQLNALLDEKGRGEFTPEKQRILDHLLAEYERVTLVRAQAAILLQQRGYDISNHAVLHEPSE